MNRVFLGGAFSIGILVFAGMNTAQAKNWNLGNGQPTEINTPEIDYRTYARLPCTFNGVEIGNSAYPPREHDQSYKKRLGRCVNYRYGSKPIFYSKDGTSVRAPYATPVVAIADMDFHYGRDFSAEYRCVDDWYKKGFTNSVAGGFGIDVADPSNPSVMRKCQKPYDGIELVFKVIGSGELVKYYHLSSTPIVPGFGSGDCKNPLMKDRVIRHTRYPEDCGGVAIKRVKKGEIIGYVGNAGNSDHFGINIFRDRRWLIAPEDNTQWESSPRDPKFFLLPVVRNPSLPNGNLNADDPIFFDQLMAGLKEKIIRTYRSDLELRKCVLNETNVKESSWRKLFESENIKLLLFYTVTSDCYRRWEELGSFK